MFELFNIGNSKISKILEKPGDKLIAEVTPSNKEVVKVSKNNGKNKYSRTTYTNNTIVETKTTKMWELSKVWKNIEIMWNKIFHIMAN